MTDPSPPSPSPPPPAAPPPAAAPRRPRGLTILVLAAFVAAIAAGAYRLAIPTLVFSNGLIGPVHLVVNDDARTVQPGETVRVLLPRSMLVGQWELDRPLSADGQPMGEVVRGSWVVRSPRGRVRRAAGPRLDTGDYFAPLVTNETDRLLRITVNAGLEGARDCGCAVRPGARRVFIGYYRLYRNTTVRATDPGGHAATFRDLGPEAEARGWSVGLRFAAGDFSGAEQDERRSGDR